MGFSTQQYRSGKTERRWKINPIWRGIGCFLLLLIPIMAWFAAELFLDSGQQIIQSDSLYRPITIKFINIAEIDMVIADINEYSASSNLVGGQFFFTIIFTVIGYGLLAFLYAVLYRLIGPPRYGPFDVPPSVMKR
jgi:hypothetical protein